MRISLPRLCLALGALLPARLCGGDFETAFRNPPESARPAVYWYWISDRISAEGITRDLEAMRAVGIGEAFIGNVDQNEKARGPVKALTEEWWSLVAHAIREGGRLGVKVGLFNSPGWSQSGGPWVRPEQAMRFVVSSETRVTGPAVFRGVLPAPRTPFQDIATLAFPAPLGDADTLALRKPAVSARIADAAPVDASALADGRLDGEWMLPVPAAGQKSVPIQIDFTVGEPFTARSLTLHSAARTYVADFELQVADAPEGPFRRVRAFTAERRNERIQVGPQPFAPVVVSFPAVTGRCFRLTGQTRPTRGVTSPALVEIELSAAARVERAPEQQLAKLFEGALPPWNAYTWPATAATETPAAAVSRGSIRDLTARVAPDGALEWEVPPGEWIIQRFGMTPTGVTNGPASPEATGLEIDKLSRVHLAAHFDAYVGKLLARLPARERSALHRVIADSYETGSCNWTDDFAARFSARYGYDAVRFLPAFSGRVVDDAASTDRFFWDLRRLVADLVATEYVGGLRELAQKQGLTLWLENYGHWGFPSEFLLYGGQTHEVGGEFWADGNMTGLELRAASSAAHLYGLKRVSAEAFTAGRNAFRNSLWDLKPRGDRAAAEGVNHFVLHVYIHQPDDRFPGVNTWFGTEFNRHNSWFADLGPWIDSLRRLHGALQAGRPAADLGYFIGEDAPRMTGPLSPRPPAGYDYDFVNADALERLAAVEEGRVAFPAGARHRLIVLPPQDTMRPEILARLGELVRAGAAIFGPRPVRSPSNAGQPAADERVRSLAAGLWPEDSASGVFAHRRVGSGHVFTGPDLAPALAALGLATDVADAPAELLWTHRSGPDGELYFVSNQGDSPLSAAPIFREAPGAPEFWDHVSTEQLRIPGAEKTTDGRRRAPLSLAPRQSGLVFFPRVAADHAEPAPLASERVVLSVAGPWSVDFSTALGGPGLIRLDELVDWTRHPDPRVQAYAGPAVYRHRFEVPPGAPSASLYLDFGRLHGQARVRLNGTDLGLIWCAPWRISTGSALRAGINELEVRVVTPWANRLRADAALPAEQRLTFLTEPERVQSGASPLPAGLLGPVTLLHRAP